MRSGSPSWLLLSRSHVVQVQLPKLQRLRKIDMRPSIGSRLALVAALSQQPARRSRVQYKSVVAAWTGCSCASFSVTSLPSCLPSWREARSQARPAAAAATTAASTASSGSAAAPTATATTICAAS